MKLFGARFLKGSILAHTFFLLSFSLSALAEDATIQSFSPQGMVRDVRQVHATFSEAMVAFGDPNANTAPFELSCPAKGSARWADARNWIFDFEQDLSAGTRCEFKLKAGMKSLAGHAVTGTTAFKFSTGGPTIARSNPYEGGQIQEDQAFVLSLKSSVDEKSVRDHAYFEVRGIQEKCPALIIQGAEAQELIRASEGRFQSDAEKKLTRIVLHSKCAFPPAAEIKLVWGKGITTQGPNPEALDQDQVLPFRVREDFSAKFSCERENANAGCIPFAPMRVYFTSEVPWKAASQIKLVGPGGKVWKSSKKVRGGESPGEGEGDGVTEGDEPAQSWVQFEGPFPELGQFKLSLPPNFRDESDRKLINASQFPLEVRTEEFPPLAKFPAEFGIVELKPEAVLPVTLRNLEPSVKASLGIQDIPGTSADRVDGKILKVGGGRIDSIVSWISKIAAQGEYSKRGESIFPSQTNLSDMKVEAFAVPKPLGGKAFEVVGIPIKAPGFYVVELESQLLGHALLGAEKPMYVSTAALVTNLAVHFKHGRESSLVWVTSLDEAKPVPDALVGVRDCHGKLVAKGKTDQDGILKIQESLDLRVSCNSESGYSTYHYGLFVTAEKEDDFSFVHTSWQKGIENWRFDLPRAQAPSPAIVHTVFDRTLFRAGETVHMKHFMRRHAMVGFAPTVRESLPQVVQLRHGGSGQKYELPLHWTSGDVAESTWKIPKGAKLGEYHVALHQEGSVQDQEEGSSYYGGDEWQSGSFRVEEFRVPLMKGTLRTPSEKLVAPDHFDVDLSVEYLAGGGASKLPVQFRYQQTADRSLSFPAFEEYAFGNGVVKEKHSSYGEGEASGDEAASNEPALQKESLVLDKAGTGRVTLNGLKKMDVPARVSMELEYRDPSGEVQTTAGSVLVYPSKRLVGLKPDSWFGSKKSLKFAAAVVGLDGNPVESAPVQVEFIQRKVYSHRKKLMGGFYAYENRVEIKKLGKACEGKTDSHGLLFCDTVPPASGNILLQAVTRDDAGHESYANFSTWVHDSEEWWFEQEDHDRIDVLAEKKRYEPGEKAVFQVRMPFREATALVTVEREGILDSFTVKLSGKKPLVEVPIKPGYAPNAFVSVLVVRGRAGDVQPTALVDLGRPAYKLGIAEINVGWKPFELKVKVTPAKALYQVREKAEIQIHVDTADGSALPAGAEVVLVAVDEGLLLLKPNDSWKLLEAMMKKRGYEVETSTAQMQVVGKRHFGLKALPHGGDGGKSATRELFDTLLFWKGNVALDSKGNARVKIPLNDSITSFRIVAVAHGGLDRFGTGSASIRSTQDLMMFSGIPPLAREGDTFPAEFTLRNSTEHPMQLEVFGNLGGKQGGKANSFVMQELTLAPAESKTVRWPVQVPSGVDSLTYDVEARLKGKAQVADRIQVSQKIITAVPVRVYQVTLTQLEPELKMKVERPKDAVPGKGGIRVVVKPTLLSGLAGVAQYMKDYPYSCLEQRTSKAIALRDKKMWTQNMEDLPSYLDSDGLAKYFPSSLFQGSDVLTAYLLSISKEAGWEIPESYRDPMVSGLQKFVSGQITRQGSLPTSDLAVRKIAALEALSRNSEVNWAMLSAIQVTPDLWPTSAVLDWLATLGRVMGVPEAEKPREITMEKQAEQVLRSRLNFQGTVMGFSTSASDGLWWLMVSNDVNAVKMLLAGMSRPEWPGLKEELPRLARGALMRQIHGHWDTTVANAWGTLAVEKFAQRFEKEPVSGDTVAKLDKDDVALKWSESPKGKDLMLPWPPMAWDLSVRHSGNGKPWVVIQSEAAIPLKAPVSSGYHLVKTWTPVEQRKPGQWSKGDIVRVHLDLEAQTDMTWVVLNDPIPAGASILGTGLGNDSKLATRKEKSAGYVWSAFEERAFDSYRAYYEFVPKGKWSVEYTVRLNQDGTMSMPASRLEAMYAPEMFGETPNDSLKIAE